MKIFSFCTLVLVAPLAAAADAAAPLDVDTAQRVYARFAELEQPPSHASYAKRWFHTTARLTAAYCWDAAQSRLPLPKALRAPPTLAGSFTLPKEGATARMCRSIAEDGFVFRCSTGTFWVPGVERDWRLPLDYLQAPYRLAEVAGVLQCELDAQRSQAQSMPIRFPASWSVRPTRQVVRTPVGARELEVGTVVLEPPDVPGWDGKPFREPRMGVLVR
jgi:hypothetical protein